jgi:hypothetical protein
MEESKLNQIINSIREDMTATGGNLAGLPPEEPPVDLRKRPYKKLPPLYRSFFNSRRKKNV